VELLGILLPAPGTAAEIHPEDNQQRDCVEQQRRNILHKLRRPRERVLRNSTSHAAVLATAFEHFFHVANQRQTELLSLASDGFFLFFFDLCDASRMVAQEYLTRQEWKI
jgi:hypothetical protein